VLIFQSRYDNATMQLAGKGAASTYGGAIYAPAGSVSTFGNGAVAAGSIVANSMACGGNGGASIGGPFPQVTFPTSGGSYAGTGNGAGSWSNQDSCSPNQSICGTVVDLSAPVTNVQMSLKQQSNGKCWDGSFTGGGNANFSANCSKYITVTSPGGAWYQAWQQGALAKGSYTLTILATDNALFTGTVTVSFTIT
jgi:hypothetical protein